jgi:hypothetical protein
MNFEPPTPEELFKDLRGKLSELESSLQRDRLSRIRALRSVQAQLQQQLEAEERTAVGEDPAALRRERPR